MSSTGGDPDDKTGALIREREDFWGRWQRRHSPHPTNTPR